MVTTIVVGNYERYNFTFIEFTMFIKWLQLQVFNTLHITATLNDFNHCTNIVTSVNAKMYIL